jgi:serine/threonine-protein kinase
MPPPLLCPKCESLASAQWQPIPGLRIVRELGRGGMGVVYLALRFADGVPVAVKTIAPAVAPSPQELERFLREANILRELQHPHIVRFQDMGEVDGLLYFSMEYVRGTDANQALKTQPPLAVRRVVALGCQLLDALEFAHARRFVHRDIKPGNLLLKVEGGREVVKVSDFGLARVYQSSTLSGLTLGGDLGGTPAYMPPEQITNFRDVQPTADQYSAAATLYTLLSGRQLFPAAGNFQKGLLMILHDEPKPLREWRPEVSAELAAVIHRALAKEPADRFPDAGAMRAALAACPS